MSHQPAIPNRTFLFFAGLFGMLGIAAGAFGAHALRGKVSAERLDVFHTGTNYQLVHAVALLAVALLPPSKIAQFAGRCFVVGIVVFSGSLYTLVLTDTSRWGAVTPIGGIAFIVGWFALILQTWRQR